MAIISRLQPPPCVFGTRLYVIYRGSPLHPRETRLGAAARQAGVIVNRIDDPHVSDGVAHFGG